MGISQTSNQTLQQPPSTINEETVERTPGINQRSSNFLRMETGMCRIILAADWPFSETKVTESMLPNSENIAYDLETYIHSTNNKATIQAFSNMVKLKI